MIEFSEMEADESSSDVSTQKEKLEVMELWSLDIYAGENYLKLS